MAWTDPPTFASGGTVTAADLNILGDDLLYLKGITDGVTASGVIVTRSAAQTITDSTMTALSFSAEEEDFGGWWSSGTNVVVPAGAIPDGFTSIIVDIAGETKYESNADHARALYLFVNGVQIDPGRTVAALDGGDSTAIDVNRKIRVEAGDIITLRTRQTSGISLDTSNTVFSVWRYAPAT